MAPRAGGPSPRPLGRGRHRQWHSTPRLGPAAALPTQSRCPRPRPRPARRFSEGIYVLYTYTADTSTGQAVQKYLSTPQAGNELNILR